MRAGDLKWSVTILRQSPELNEWNEPVGEWLPLRTVRAQKIHKAEDEKFAASQRYESRTVSFRMYFQADILPTDRLLCDGLEYDIRGIRELGFRRGTEIAAEYQS